MYLGKVSHAALKICKAFKMYNSPSLFSLFKYFSIFVQNHLPMASESKLINDCEENWKRKKLSLSATHFLVEWNASMRTQINKIVFVLFSVTWYTETSHLTQLLHIKSQMNVSTSCFFFSFVLNSCYIFWTHVMKLMCHYQDWHLHHSRFWIASNKKKFFFSDNIDLLLIVSERKRS